jgi:hypothetical protein
MVSIWIFLRAMIDEVVLVVDPASEEQGKKKAMIDTTTI